MGTSRIKQSRTRAMTPKQQWIVIFVFMLMVMLLYLVWSGMQVHPVTKPTNTNQKPTGQLMYQCGVRLGPMDYSENGLCIVNADGTGYKTLYTNLMQDYPRAQFLSPSRDWKHIVFTTTAGDYYVLLIAQTDGSGVTSLQSELGKLGKPSWSPDGKTLAFAKFDHSGQAEGIYTIQADRSNLMQLSKFGDGPVWSPDGKYIAFTNQQDGIYLLNIATGTQTQIANGISAKSLDWSPSGLQITYESGGLGLINVDGSNRKQFYGDCSSPTWSPDGTKIAYLCQGALCVANSDGSSPTELAPNFMNALLTNWSYITSFDWSPDGQYIVYEQGTFCPMCELGRSAALWIVKADGSQQTKLMESMTGVVAWGSAP